MARKCHYLCEDNDPAIFTGVTYITKNFLVRGMFDRVMRGLKVLNYIVRAKIYALSSPGERNEALKASQMSIGY